MKEYEFKKSIPEERLDEVINFSYQFFSETMPLNAFSAYLRGVSNLDISFILVDENDSLMGVYLLGNTQVTEMIEAPKYEDLIGVEGVLLAVDESIRGFGFGNRLKDIPKTLGVDYIWGQQFKSLNNLQDWLKRRELVGMTQFLYITAEIF